MCIRDSTNAVHGFVMMLLRVLDEEAPTAAAVAFDVSKHTFRTDLYDGYKANRKPMPEELRQQDPVIRDLLERMGLRIVECEGFEADDILGTLSRQCEEMGMEALLVTGDRDSFQLAGENTSILYTCLLYTSHAHGLHGLPRRVDAANVLQQARVEALHADGQPVDAHLPVGAQFLHRQRAGVGFQRHLCPRRETKRLSLIHISCVPSS